MNDSNWVIAFAAIATSVATIALAVVAVFQDRLRAWLSRPCLEILLKPQPPDCHKTTLRSADGSFECDCYYLRIRVNNSGDRPAEMVEVFVESLKRKRVDESFEVVPDFLPLNFNWSHIGGAYFRSIAPTLEKHCDIARIIDPARRRFLPGEDDPRLGLPQGQTILSLELVVKPNTLTHLLAPGTYRLRIGAAASNAAVVRRTLEVTLSGHWYGDEGRMLSDGVGMKLV